MIHINPHLTESEIRQTIQQQRLAMGPDLVRSQSLRVIQNFQRCWGQANGPGLRGRCVGVYRSFSFEVDTSTLVQWCLAEGATLFYPKVTDSKEEKMVFIPQELPRQESVGLNLHNNNLDIIFVPGVVFGERGERIGMGRGYYDYYLATHQHAMRIALAFDFQVQPVLPQKLTDQSMHWLMTESREFKMPELNRRLGDLKKIEIE